MNEKIDRTKYKTKTFQTGYFGSKRKIARLVRKGWEVASTTQLSRHHASIVMRKEK